jgi:hypothetical protein
LQQLLETIQAVISLSILNGRLRNEIYVQIVKQLSENSNVSSVRRGLELLSCMCELGFSPQQRFGRLVSKLLHQMDATGDLIVMVKWV